MAYVNQQKKAELAPGIKAVLKKYGIKGSIAVRNYSTLVVNIKSGKLDIMENWFQKATENGPQNRYGEVIKKPESIQVNQFWINEHYTGEVKDFLVELYSAMKGPDWYDRSDSMTDYFDTSHYMNINVGDWDKPYSFEA